MSNHVHLMISTEFGHHTSNALRDLKKFTSKKIVAAIADKEQPESRCKTWFPAGCCGYSNRQDDRAIREASTKNKE